MTVKTAADPAKKTEEEPLWFLKLVELGQFYRTCKSHPSNVCNFYCINCMSGAFCPQCKREHAKCGGRNILTLTAYKASGAATLRTEEMKTICDISDICIYVINSKQIVFIQKKGGDGHTGSGHGDERCWNCSYRIKLHVKCCSIECKLEDIRSKKGEANADQACKRKSCEDAHANSIVEAEQEGESMAPTGRDRGRGYHTGHRSSKSH